MPNLYTVTVPLHLQVEANSKAEAERILAALFREVMDGGLPVGAGIFMKEAELRAHLKANTKLS